MAPNTLAADESAQALPRAAADGRRAVDELGSIARIARDGIRILAPAELSGEQRETARRHFLAVFPALTPLAIDPGHPFPNLKDGSVHVAVSLRRRDARRRRAGPPHLLAVVQIPSALPRLVQMPLDGGREYALLEEIVAAGAGDLFPGHAVGETAAFRVLSATRSQGPRRRDRAVAVGLEISAAASPELGMALCRALDLEPRDAVRVEGPLRPADLLAPDERRREDARSAASIA